MNLFADYSFIGLAHLLIGTASTIIWSFNNIFFSKFVLGLFFGPLISIVLLKENSPFHWTELKKNPFDFILNCFQHKISQFILRGYLSLFTYLLVTLGLLQAILILWPDDGMHVRDVLAHKEVVLQAVGAAFAFASLAVAFKASFFVMMGVINNWWDFKLKMIAW